MARIILITGGSRSGKSSYAQQLGESLPAPRVYVATCPVIDDEIRQRIDKHRRARDAALWRTVEEEVALSAVLGGTHDAGVVLVECLTLWINNLMYHAEKSGREVDEDRIAAECEAVLEACHSHPGTILFVTNEVGMGIVPDNKAARVYRDLVGRCNQVIAARADQVTLVSCGIPLHLKGSYERNHG